MSDNPSGAVHPNLFFLGWIVATVGLEWLVRTEALLPGWAPVAAKVLILPGSVLFVWSVISCRRHDATLEHTRETTSLVTTGPFRITRNPIYLAMLLMLAGFGLHAGSVWALALTLPLAVVIHRKTVIPEERYLERKFGRDYLEYRSSVRRWV
jgi:protein-S-isoprenylcysteine O-methyltransferase Ste14